MPDLNLIEWRSAPMPVYYCLGTRPTILQLDPAQTGWTLCLIFQRNEQTALLPISDLTESTDGQHIFLPSQQTTVQHTCADLKQDGWELTGRIGIRFNGSESADTFWQDTNAWLTKNDE